MTGPPAWQSAENAEMYDAYSRTFPKYRDTSRDLVSSLKLSPDSSLLDLACGTGVTTEEILRKLGPQGSVLAVDGSDAMLNLAGRRIADPRVSFLCAQMSELPDLVDRTLDAVCNSAIWQLGDLATLLASVRGVTRRGGEFACNWGPGFLSGLDESEEAHERDLLGEVLLDIARSQNLLPPRRAQSGSLRWPTVEDVIATFDDAGLHVVKRWWFEQSDSPDGARAWLSIPVFTEWSLGHLPHARRLELLDEAWERWDKRDTILRWFCLKAVAK